MTAPPAPVTPRSWPPLLLRWILALCLFGWLGARHWPETVDDVVISVNFARQWAEGHGLTWTTGERVEGYSNFGLVAILAAGIRLGADAGLLAQVISVLAVAGVLGALSRWLPHNLAGTAALLALAAWGPLDHWGMMGLEGPLFGLLLGLGWALAVSPRWGLGVVLLALASVTRPEGPLYLGLGLLPRLTGARRWTPGDGLALLSVALVLVYHAVRVSWFGAIWPTPYLVKLASVPWTRFGLAQMAGDLALATPILGAFALSLRLGRGRVVWVALPLVAQSLLLWRASGDWMTHGRLILPGLLATLLAAAHQGTPRDPSLARGLLALGLVVLSSRWMPTGYGKITLASRPLPTPVEVSRALRRGLDTPLSEDVLWASRNVPSGDRVMAVDAGMLGAVPELRLIDTRGLTHRGFAEAAATRQEEPFMRALVSDPATRPEWLRIANWDGSPLPTLPDWLAAVYTLREEVRYGPSRIGWYANHERTADVATASRRLDALWAAFPSQPLLTWHAALLRAELGDMDGAEQIAREGARRWPEDARFAEAPASLSFPTGPFGLDQVRGRGVGLYWNTAVWSRPIRREELTGLRLRLDADAPGTEGARAEIVWSGPCAETASSVAVRAPTLVAPPACEQAGTTRVRVAFTNDDNANGDRNLYVSLVPVGVANQ